MTRSKIRRWAPAALLSLSALAACGDRDARTDKIEAGIDRDSALKVLASGTAPDSSAGVPVADAPISADTLLNIWRRTQYLVGGKNIEFLFYSPNNEKWKATDTVPEGKVIPVTLVDGKVLGVGKGTMDSVSAANGIPKNKF